MGRHDASAGGRQSLARALRPRRRDHDPRRGRGDPVPPGFRKATRRACRLVWPDSNEYAGGAPAGFRGPRARDVSENRTAGLVLLVETCLGILLQDMFDAGFVLDALEERAFSTENSGGSSPISWGGRFSE